jgi:hypothetical protein
MMLRTAARTTKTLVARTALIALIPVLGLIAATPAEAQTVRHVRVVIDETFVNEVTTEACGTTVVNSVEGTLNVTLLYNQAGLIAKEIDPSGGGTVTFTAPRTGNSFSFPFNTAIIDYGAGAAVGSTFTAKFVGLIGHVPGFISSDAGQVIVTGVVTGFDENGLPELDFRDVQVQHGNFHSQEEILAAICAALTG